MTYLYLYNDGPDWKIPFQRKPFILLIIRPIPGGTKRTELRKEIWYF